MTPPRATFAIMLCAATAVAATAQGPANGQSRRPTPVELGIQPSDPWSSTGLVPEFEHPAEQEDGAPDGFTPLSISPAAVATPVPPDQSVQPKPSTDTLVPRNATTSDMTQSGAGASLVRSGVALAAVVGLIVLLAWGYRACTDLAGRKIGRRASNRGLIEIVARQSLTPKLAVWLLRVGDRVLLVGSGGDGLRSLDVVVDPDACAKLLGRAAAGKPGSSSSDFNATLADAAKPYVETPQPDEGDEPTHITEIKARLADALHRLKGAKTG